MKIEKKHSIECKKWVNSVIDRLNCIQSIDNKKEIHFSHDPTGLGGQISRRILALRIAYITGARASFPNETMYPYEMCFDQLPSYMNVVDGIDIFSEDVSWVGAVKFNFWDFWGDEARKNVVYNYIPPGLNDDVINGGLLFDGVLESFLKLNSNYNYKVKNEITKLNLPEKYIAVHFRRGDKTAETPYVPAKIYRNAVIEVANNTGVNNIFVASDSPSAIDDLDLPSRFNVLFDSSERRLNNANHKFLMKNRGESAAETLVAIKNIEILSNSLAVVGQDNAHFATIAASRVYLNSGGTYFGKLLRGNIMMDSLGWSIFYGTKNIIKTALKALLPWATLKNISGK
jgi:hypothetical protein